MSPQIPAHFQYIDRWKNCEENVLTGRKKRRVSHAGNTDLMSINNRFMRTPGSKQKAPAALPRVTAMSGNDLFPVICDGEVDDEAVTAFPDGALGLQIGIVDGAADVRGNIFPVFFIEFAVCPELTANLR